jgi:hypothetical protein
MKPLAAIRRYCLWCCLNQRVEVQNCPVSACSLHSFRFGKGVMAARILEVIRKRCLDCTCGSTLDTKSCGFVTCTLYPFRMGINPALTGRRKKNLWV